MNKPLTKKRFESLLTKAAHPVSEWQNGQVVKETSDVRLSCDCTDKCKCPDKTANKEDLPSD